MTKKYPIVLGLFVSLFLISIVAAAEIPPANPPIAPPPARTNLVNIECQFYSFSESSVIGGTCSVVKNSSYTCVTETSQIDQMDSKGNPTYYSSKCNIEIPMAWQSSQLIEGKCVDKSSILTAYNRGISTDNYLRFNCDNTAPPSNGLWKTILNFFRKLFGK